MLQGLPIVLGFFDGASRCCCAPINLKTGGWVKGKMCPLMRYLILNKIKREIGIKVLPSNVLEGIIL